MVEIEGFKELKLRYLNGNRAEKAQILESICEVHGCHRKSAIRLLNRGVRTALEAPRARGRRGRRPRYQDPAFIQKLSHLWSEMDYQCGRNMRAVLPRWLPGYEEEHGLIVADTRERLLAVSAATMDRLLRPYRIRDRWRGGTKATPLRDEIPISTKAFRDDRPGHIEVDTVAHCGGDMSGRFLWSFTATDIVTGWTEVRSVWAKGMAPIIEQFVDMRTSFPFPILSFDSDNGGEFINRAMFLFLKREGIDQSRSRAYESNDNAHVEQKNRTYVRQYLGEMRIDNPEVGEALSKVLKEKLSVLRNFFFPTRKLLSADRVNGVTYKRYDSPLTPFERVLRSSHVPDDVKAQLRAHEAAINPVRLRKQLRASLRQVLRHASVTPNYEASVIEAFGNT